MTLVSLRNQRGTSVILSSFGARLVELLAADRDGVFENIVLGFDSEQHYRDDPGGYFGATVGRVAGRLAGSRFVGGGLDFEVTANEGGTHLHGGPARAFDRVEWEVASSALPGSVQFAYTSPAGEEGYPGTLTVTSAYRLTDSDELELTMTATTDAPTPVNLVNHAYFNLSGIARRPVVEHHLMIDAVSILDADARLLPVGGIVPVEGTAYDFRRERRIGDALPEGGSEPWPGIDSTFVLRGSPGAAATLWDPMSGRSLRIDTTEPTLQVYSGNRIPQGTGRSGTEHGPGRAICLEAHRVPDSPKLPEWPSIVIAPGAEYHQRTVWSLGTR